MNETLWFFNLSYALIINIDFSIMGAVLQIMFDNLQLD